MQPEKKGQKKRNPWLLQSFKALFRAETCLPFNDRRSTVRSKLSKREGPNPSALPLRPHKEPFSGHPHPSYPEGLIPCPAESAPTYPSPISFSPSCKRDGKHRRCSRQGVPSRASMTSAWPCYTGAADSPSCWLTQPVPGCSLGESRAGLSAREAPGAASPHGALPTLRKAAADPPHPPPPPRGTERVRHETTARNAGIKRAEQANGLFSRPPADAAPGPARRTPQAATREKAGWGRSPRGFARPGEGRQGKCRLEAPQRLRDDEGGPPLPRARAVPNGRPPSRAFPPDADAAPAREGDQGGPC